MSTESKYYKYNNLHDATFRVLVSTCLLCTLMLTVNLLDQTYSFSQNIVAFVTHLNLYKDIVLPY